MESRAHAGVDLTDTRVSPFIETTDLTPKQIS
jgi:hypothetical protein